MIFFRTEPPSIGGTLFSRGPLCDFHNGKPWERVIEAPYWQRTTTSSLTETIMGMWKAIKQRAFQTALSRGPCNSPSSDRNLATLSPLTAPKRPECLVLKEPKNVDASGPQNFPIPLFKAFPGIFKRKCSWKLHVYYKNPVVVVTLR